MLIAHLVVRVQSGGVSSVGEGGGGWHELDGTISHVELTSSLPSYKALHALKKKETAVYESSMELTTLCPYACTAAYGVNQLASSELACITKTTCIGNWQGIR